LRKAFSKPFAQTQFVRFFRCAFTDVAVVKAGLRPNRPGSSIADR